MSAKVDDEATRFVPGTTTPDDDEVSRTMPEDTMVNEDETTQFMPEDETLADEDEATRFVPDEAETIEDGESTRAIEAFDEDESTRTLSATGDTTGSKTTPIEIPDDESTRALSEIADTGETAERMATAKTLPSDSHEADTFQDIDFKSDHILENRYRLQEILGRGGFGAVYLAEDVKLKRRCVVKQMLIQGKSRKDIAIYQANFRREANLLAELNDPGHPNIPEIYDYFSTESGNYLVMKYIEGRNLKDSLQQSEDRIPWRETVRYAIGVCSALDYMHTKGHEPILHRDIKPANILLGDDGRVWLVDFGLAKAEPVESSSEEIAATKASGSMGYTPLEQWFGQAVPTSDIYALGATLHHLVTGVSPLQAFNGKFNLKLIRDLHGQFTPIRKIDRTLPKRLEQIIDRAVAADPAERPTPHQLQQQLEALVTAGQAVALYTFKNGKSAKTVLELVDLCEKNREEAETYLYNGDFERWFLLINRNDLAEAAVQAVKLGRSRANGLERFLKLIVPNLFYRRLGKAARHLGFVATQVLLITLAVVLFLLLAGSFGARWLVQRAIANTEWDFYTLDLEGDNHYTEAFLIEKFKAVPIFDETEVEVHPPDGFDLIGHWHNLPLNLSISVPISSNLYSEHGQPRFQLTEINGLPLFLIGDNISAGINQGIGRAIQKSPFDLERLTVQETEIVFRVKESTDPDRPAYIAPGQSATPTPAPTPSPTPAGKAMVVVFNQAPHDIVLEIKGENSWEIGAANTQVIEIAAGEYAYTVRNKGGPDILAIGTKIWNADKAYQLRIVTEDGSN
jgi:serine/threonine protein kinase